MLIWGSTSTPPRTPLSHVLQKWVTPNHSHSCQCTHCIPPWRTVFEEGFLAIKLHEKLGSGARVEIPCSGLSFRVTPSLSKPQPTAHSSAFDALGKDQGEHLHPAASLHRGRIPFHSIPATT